jgi:hypothetical protein
MTMVTSLKNVGSPNIVSRLAGKVALISGAAGDNGWRSHDSSIGMAAVLFSVAF